MGTLMITATHMTTDTHMTMVIPTVATDTLITVWTFKRHLVLNLQERKNSWPKKR